MLSTILIVLLSVILLIGLTLVLRPNEILSKQIIKDKVTTPESNFILWKNNNIHYTDEGEGEVVLMIHGLGGSFYNFEGLKNEMKSNYRVIRVDLPGMGLSDMSHITEDTNYLKEYLEFFNFFLEDRAINSCYVMGNSLGGMVSWVLAATFPDKVKGLVLFNSAGYEVDKVISRAAGPIRYPWFSPVMRKGLPQFLTRLALPYLFGDKSKIHPDEYKNAYYLINREGNLKTVIGLSSHTEQAPDLDLLKNITAPTLIFWGKEDAIIPVKHAHYFERDISNSKAIIYSPCGHMAMTEFPQECYKEFELFFNSKSI